MPNRRAILTGLAASLVTHSALAAGDAQTLQAEIEAATAAGKPYRLPPSATLTGPLRLPEGAHLIGQRGRSRLVLGSQVMITADHLQRLTLEGVTLEGPGDAQGALARFMAIKDLRVVDCSFQKAAGNALMLQGCGGRIERNGFGDIRRAAIYANDSTGLTIEGNTIERCGENGIQVHRSVKGDDGSIIRANRISDIRADPGGSGEYGNGINTFRGGGVVIDGNVIRRCAYSAVRDNGGGNTVISNNNCAAIGETALYAEFAFEGVVFTGNIVDSAMTGISIANFGTDGGRLGIVSGNLLRNLVRKPHPATKEIEGGVGISVEADVSVSGNTIENAAYAGLLLGWGPYLRDVTASGNTIRQAETGVMVTVAQGAGGANINGNSISGAKDAVLGMEWTKRATGDLTRETPPRQLKVAENIVR